MARPNNSTAIAGHIKGLKEAKAAFQALPQLMREGLLEATEASVREIARLAQAKVASSPSINTRTLYDSIGWSINKKNGRGRAGVSNIKTTIQVGGKKYRVKGRIIVGRGGGAAGSRLIRPSRYAHLVEFGARHMKAEPFMIPAAEAEKLPYLRRCQRAGKEVEPKVAAIGMRYA